MRGWPRYYVEDNQLRGRRNSSRDQHAPDFWDVVEAHDNATDEWLHEHTVDEICDALNIGLRDAQDMRWAAMARLGVKIPIRREDVRHKIGVRNKAGTLNVANWRNYNGKTA